MATNKKNDKRNVVSGDDVNAQEDTTIQAEDSSYERNFAVVKFLGTTRVTPVKPKDKPKAKLYLGPPKLQLRIFCTLSGIKPDQMAGFARHAKHQKLGPLTIEEWKKSLVEFQNKPMR